MIVARLAPLMLLASALAIPPACAEPVQYQFTPPPPIPHLPASPPPSYPVQGVAPPQPAPRASNLEPFHVTPPPAALRRPGGTVQTARGRPVIVPVTPGETFGDRVTTCSRAGASAGLRASRLSAFVGRCVN